MTNKDSLGGVGRWARAYKKAARQDGYRSLLDEHGYDPDDEGVDGAPLAERLVAWVAYVLAARSIGVAVDPEKVARFLSLHAYGEVPATGWSVRFAAAQVTLYADTIGDIDFEDLSDAFGLDDIEIAYLPALLTEAEAAGVVEAIRKDLTFDGDELEITWAFDPDGPEQIHLSVAALEDDEP